MDRGEERALKATSPLFQERRGRFSRLGLVVWGGLLLFSPLPSLAQSAEELAHIEKQMEEQKAAAASLEKKEKKTADELDSLREKLISATDALQKKQDEQERLESKLDEFENAAVAREAALSLSRGRLASLTSAMVQVSKQPPGLFLLREKSADDHIHRTILLRSVLPRLKAETTSLTREIETLERLQKQASDQKRLVSAAQQNLQWQRHNLDQLVKSRQGLLQKTTAEKEALARQLDSLASEAKDLRQLMEKVSEPAWGKAVGKGVSSRNVVLKPSLKMPTGGKIIRAFGVKDEFGVTSSGVTFFGSPAGPVVAPQGGKVVFAGPFRGYGQIVILQHPGGYHSFLSGFGRIDADVGQTVDSGEPLGLLPVKGQGKPELYFEWRKGSNPVDPTAAGAKISP